MVLKNPKFRRIGAAAAAVLVLVAAPTGGAQNQPSAAMPAQGSQELPPPVPPPAGQVLGQPSSELPVYPGTMTPPPVPDLPPPVPGGAANVPGAAPAPGNPQTPSGLPNVPMAETPMAPAVPPPGAPAAPGTSQVPGQPNETVLPPADAYADPQSPTYADDQQAAPGNPSAPGSASDPRKSTVVSVDQKLPRYATLNTSMGKIKIKLFSQQVPNTVRNFVELAMGHKEFVDAKSGRRVRRPFYNGLIFHRVIRGFVIQTGCPFGNGKGGPGYTFRDEFDPGIRHDRPGIVSMANIGKDTNGSQFFITMAPLTYLDDKYTAFGEVVKGMDVVYKIGNVKTGPTDRPVKRVFLMSVDTTDN